MDKPVTERIINWNAKRYEQQFDYVLACRLLLEETEELFAAKSDVERLDAIGDIVFVAVGVFWKLGFSNDKIYDILYVHDLTQTSLSEAHHWSMCIQAAAFDLVDHEIEGVWPGLTLALHSLFVTALGAAHGLGCSAIFYDIIHAICDSNDTKVVKGKTPSHIKANIDKGENFVPPTGKLLELYSLNQQHKRKLN